MRNYAPINDDKDVVTKEYVDPVKSQAAINRTTLGYQCKNLLDVRNYASKYTAGVTASPNGVDGLTFSGTANNTFYLAWNDKAFSLKKEDYILSYAGDITSDKPNNTFLRVRKSDNTIICDLPLSQTSKSFSLNVDDELYFIAVYTNVTANVQGTIKPMIRYADITDSTYEPYQPSLIDRCLLKDTAGAWLGVSQSGSITIDNLSSYTALWLYVVGNVSGINFTTNLIVPIAYLAKSTSNSVQLAGGIPSSAYITSEGPLAAKNMDGTITAKVSGNTLDLTISDGIIGSVEVVSLM